MILDVNEGNTPPEPGKERRRILAGHPRPTQVELEVEPVDREHPIPDAPTFGITLELLRVVVEHGTKPACRSARGDRRKSLKRRRRVLQTDRLWQSRKDNRRRSERTEFLGDRIRLRLEPCHTHVRPSADEPELIAAGTDNLGRHTVQPGELNRPVPRSGNLFERAEKIARSKVANGVQLQRDTLARTTRYRVVRHGCADSIVRACDKPGIACASCDDRLLAGATSQARRLTTMSQSSQTRASTRGAPPAKGGATTRRRHPPEVRQALILEAAKELIAEVGLGGATAREIAARCDISTGTLTHHFPSMDQLLVEALRSSSKEFTDRNLGAAEAERSARDRIQLLIETALPDKPEALRNWRLWLEYWARAAHEPELAALHRERYREWRGAFERVIAEGVGTGEFDRVDAMMAARELVGLFDGLCIEVVIGGQVTVGQTRKILLAWIDSRLLSTV